MQEADSAGPAHVWETFRKNSFCSNLRQGCRSLCRLLSTLGRRGDNLNGLLILGLLVGFSAVGVASEFYAAPNGSASGNGSISRPWDLATALGQPPGIRPGDTIWLRGGTYTFPPGGNILCGLRGTATAPITVAQYPGERATLDLKGSTEGLFFTTSPNPAGAAYVNFKDFEVTNSDTNRSISRGSPDIYVRTSDHLKFINLIVHDTSTGFDLNKEATNTEVYGSIVYYCDDASDPRGYAHGIYIQNVSGFKKATDNIVFSNSGYGIHAYPHADDSSLLNVTLTGNISFNAGSLGSYLPAPDFLLGGEAVATNPVASSNKTYKASLGNLWNQRIGYAAGCSNPTVTDNYFVGTTVLTNCSSGLVLTGNIFYGGTFTELSYGTPLIPFSLPSNTYMSARPTGTKVFVTPNQYEAGRANIVVYNWDRQSSVEVNVSGVLSVGAGYELRNAQDFYGAPVQVGVYNGAPLHVPMTSLSVASPAGFGAPPPTGPDFNVFVLRTTAASPPGPGPSACDPTYGDLNQDGIVNATDLVILSNYLAGNLSAGTPPFTAPLGKADLDRSGRVDAVDLVILQNFLVGNITCLPR